MIRGIGTAGSRNGTIERRESERVREGGGERGIERGKEPNKTSRGKRIEWGAQGQDMIINDKHDSTPPLTERLLAHSRRNPGGNGGNHR